ncbi:Mu transposase C-terminal domain-containing protein [Microbacterium sp. YJN-G]|uniref:Mu transposase C-terminal domain-containing protein n=1 Tax=unclassified Microbacterium TaxID=2609290 RepID=UPI0018784833|nr:Mu transposase C-terminal domain-containing protein [Microbacterium sp. YJN-G]
MRAGIGTRLTWDDHDFIIIAIDYRHAVLRSLKEDFVRQVVIEELLRLPNASWHDVRPPSSEPSDLQLIAELPAIERRLVEAWVEQFEAMKLLLDKGAPLGSLLNDVRTAMQPHLDASTETVRRKFRRYLAEGVIGLVDGRRLNGRKPGIDARISAALSELGAAGIKRSSGTRTRTVDNLKWMLEEDFGDDLELPSDRTLHRLIAAHPTARKLNSSARARETAANKPGRAFELHGSLRPGEHVQIDSTVIDVPSRLLDGRLNRAELTIIHDVATRSILAALVRAIATNSADLAGVLARALTPYEFRPPGAREQRERVAASWAGQFMIEQDKLDQYRLAQPYIFPETITTDNGKIYRSEAFRSGCARVGISLIFAGKETPTDKPHVERTFESMVTRFVQYLEGFTGGSVDRRGRAEPTDDVLAVAQLQELLEDWVAIEWQNRPHDGLTDPLLPGRSLTPNEMFRAYRRVAPEIHVPFGVDDFIGLLPSKKVTLQDYGINQNRRVYRSKRLPDLRAAGSRGEGATRPCVIRYDPHNPLYVWVEHDGAFVPFRATPDLLDEPMGGDIWRESRATDADADRVTREDAAQLADRMKRAQWVRPGTKRNRAARSAEVNRDPMHYTSAAQADARDDAAEEQVEDEVIWERGGGFSLLDDDDGVWERLT